MKSVFVSYKYEDRTWYEKLKNWSDKGRLGMDVKIVAETEDKRQHGYYAVRNHLSPKLQGTAAVIVLVGEDTQSSEWVKYEIHHALSNHKKIIVVRIPQTTGAAPLAVRNHKEIAFEPNVIENNLK